MRRRWEGHSDWVRAVCLSNDGKTALSGSDDSTVIVWDVKSGEIRQRLAVISSVWCLSLKGTQVALGDPAGQVQFLEIMVPQASQAIKDPDEEKDTYL